jgi:Ca2+-binding RTX toxin-like protein
MRGKRLYTVSALLGLGTLAGCATNDSDKPGRQAEGPTAIEGDWGDESKYPELGGAYSNLTAMSGTCTFAAKEGAVTIALDTSAQTVVIAKRAVDSLLVINGIATCTDSVSNANTTVSTKSIKTISVTAATASADQNVVLDFLAGTFAVGAKGKAGITVKLDGDGSNGDTLAIRGTSGKDTFAAGASGVATGATGFAVNNDTYPDVDIIGVENLSISLAAGDDTFTGAGGFGTGNAFPTALTVYGGADKDTLTGGSGADSVNGGDGDDVLAGGLGADKINGDADNDVINAAADVDGSDVMICGAGATDKVSYALRGSAGNGTTEKLNVSVGTPYWDDDSNGSTPTVPHANDGDSATNEGDDVDTTCEVLVGGMGDDVLSGDSAVNTIYGGPGADTLSGAGGADILYGEAGDDTFDEALYADVDGDGIPAELATSQGPTGADTFIGGDGTDLVDYSERSVTVTVIMDGDVKTIATVAAGTSPRTDGESGENDNIVNDIENIYGGHGNDNLTGNALNNVLRGGYGNDVLTGLAGDDTFDEQKGWDPTANSGAGDWDVALSSGNDTLIGGTGVDTADYSLRTAALIVTMDGISGTPGAYDGVDIDGNGAADEHDDVYDDVENLLGGTGNDTLTGNAGDNDIKGGAGADTIAGLGGNDNLAGDAGDDSIDGGAGDDTIDGGANQTSGSVITCGAGDDVAFSSVASIGASDTSCELKF